MPDSIRKECFKVQQGGVDFYAFVLDSKTLREISFVSKREIGNPKGYQRYLNEDRIKEVGEYIKKPRSTFPNSIIVSLDSTKARFEPSQEENRGTLVIPKEPDIAWIIDGQHRLNGFKYSEGKEFDLLIAAYLGLPETYQATIFKVINSKQKGVNLSLIYDLIELTKDAEYQDQRAHEIVKALNCEIDSVWKDNIKMLGIGKGIISQAALIAELKKLLNDKIFEEYPVGEQVKILKDYFAVLKELFPIAWLSKKHVLCKTLGTAAVLLIMPKVLIHCRIKGNFNKTTMKELLKSLVTVQIPLETGFETIDFSGKQLGAFGGRKGQRKLADILEKSLPSIRPTG
jgi:DGQHR domain-containing protein